MPFFYASLAVAIAYTVVFARAEADLDLILYGADGCIGHFAASYLAKQPDLKWAIAGRTQAHLHTVLETLAREGGSSNQPEIIAAPLDGSVDPKTWVTRAKVVITAAGPYSKYGGELLLQACAETGVHYADASDEFYWQRQMIDKYDAVAQQSGAKIIYSSGFCVLVGDLGAQLAIQKLGASARAQVSVDAWLQTYNGGISSGVRNQQKAEKTATYPKGWKDDPYVLAPDVPAHLRVDTKVEGMGYPSYVFGEGIVVHNIFGPYDARLMRRSFVKLNQKVQLRVGSAQSMYTQLGTFTLTHPAFGNCPTQRTFNDGSWAYRFQASAQGRSHSIRLTGSGDPGYYVTSTGLAEVGLCLAGKTSGCMKTNVVGGIYTPMVALDAHALQRRLETIGLLNTEKWAASMNETMSAIFM